MWTFFYSFPSVFDVLPSLQTTVLHHSGAAKWSSRMFNEKKA